MRPVVPDDAPLIGRWIDVNLTQQVVVAYEARTTARVARASTGRPGWETPPGAYVIQQRVASETMIGASYYVPHVRWMQYFSSDGMALHENYWLDGVRVATSRERTSAPRRLIQ